MSTLTRRDFLQGAALSAAALGFPAVRRLRAQPTPPNIVVIFLDDSGWGDFPPFGNPAYPAPNVRQLASEGCRYNNFYVPQAICSASRAALLSGCYPGRNRVWGAHGPGARGLEPRFKIISEVLKQRQYATGVFGKWHIGDQPDTRPPARGFDESCGLMYSNDMWEHHPENPEYWGRFPLQYWENGRVTIDRMTPEHQTMLTTWYTEHAVDFISRHRTAPFFLYVPHAMPHVPLFVSQRFAGKSGLGLYADVMMEIDWSVGEILRALRETHVEDNTLVVLSSDNGPWTSYGNHAGTTPFREAKGTSFDGGTRSACVMKMPGRIRAGSSSNTMFSTVDLLPTIAQLAGAPRPANDIDGRNVWDLIIGTSGATNPHAYYPFSTEGTFEGVMSGDGRWKLHLPHAYRTLVTAGRDGAAGKYRQETIGRSLFDMLNDPLETTDVLSKYPDVARRLGEYAEEHRKQFYPNQAPR